MNSSTKSKHELESSALLRREENFSQLTAPLLQSRDDSVEVDGHGSHQQLQMPSPTDSATSMHSHGSFQPSSRSSINTSSPPLEEGGSHQAQSKTRSSSVSALLKRIKPKTSTRSRSKRTDVTSALDEQGLSIDPSSESLHRDSGGTESSTIPSSRLSAATSATGRTPSSSPTPHATPANSMKPAAGSLSTSSAATGSLSTLTQITTTRSQSSSVSPHSGNAVPTTASPSDATMDVSRRSKTLKVQTDENGTSPKIPTKSPAPSLSKGQGPSDPVVGQSQHNDMVSYLCEDDAEKGKVKKGPMRCFGWVRGDYANILSVSFAFFFVFMASSVQNYLSSLFGDVGDDSLAILFGLTPVASIVAMMAIHKFGERAVILFGCMCTTVSAFVLALDVDVAVLAASVVAGVAGVIWVAQGSLLTKNSTSTNRGIVSGLFFGIYMGSTAVGGLTSYTVYKNVSTSSFFLVFGAISLLSIPCAWMIDDTISSSDYQNDSFESLASGYGSSSPLMDRNMLNVITADVRILFRRSKLLVLVFPSMVWTGVQYSVWTAVFPTLVHKDDIGALIAVLALCDVVSSFLFGSVSDKLGRSFCLIPAVGAFLGAIYLIHDNISAAGLAYYENDPDTAVWLDIPIYIFGIAALLGVADGTYQTLTISFIAELSSHNPPPAFLIFAILQNVSAAAIYFSYAYMSLLDQSTVLYYVTIAVLGLAVVTFVSADAVRVGWEGRYLRLLNRMWIRGRAMREREQERIRNAQRKHLVTDELVETEKKYIDCLAAIVEGYYEPLQHMRLISKTDVETIFGQIPLLLQTNSALYSALSSRMITREEGQEAAVGDIFVKMSNFLKVYGPYLNTYNDSLATLAENKNRNRRFRHYLKEKQYSAESQFLDLESLMIMPVQRLPRYALLLQEIIKVSDSKTSDYKNVELALSRIREVTNELNEKKREAESVQKVFEVQNRFEVSTEFISPTRRFVHEGSVLVMVGKNKMLPTLITKQNLQHGPGRKLPNPDKLLHAVGILFNDMFVIAKPKMKQRHSTFSRKHDSEIASDSPQDRKKPMVKLRVEKYLDVRSLTVITPELSEKRPSGVESDDSFSRDTSPSPLPSPPIHFVASTSQGDVELYTTSISEADTWRMKLSQVQTTLLQQQ